MAKLTRIGVPETSPHILGSALPISLSLLQPQLVTAPAPSYSAHSQLSSRLAVDVNIVSRTTSPHPLLYLMMREPLIDC